MLFSEGGDIGALFLANRDPKKILRFLKIFIFFSALCGRKDTNV